MAPGAPRGRRSDRFPTYVALAVFAVVSLVVVIVMVTSAHPAKEAWLFVVPVLLAGLAWAFLSRRRAGDELPRTLHQYSVQAPGGRAPPVASAVVERLEAHGYQVALAQLDEAGRERPGRSTADLKLGDAAVRLRERRVDAEVGEIVIRVSALPDGRMMALVEAFDTGPGLYDEMAQYLVTDLAKLIPNLDLVATNKPVERCSASTLGQGLPERPYGLALLPRG